MRLETCIDRVRPWLWEVAFCLQLSQLRAACTSPGSQCHPVLHLPPHCRCALSTDTDPNAAHQSSIPDPLLWGAQSAFFRSFPHPDAFHIYTMRLILTPEQQSCACASAPVLTRGAQHAAVGETDLCCSGSSWKSCWCRSAWVLQK